MSAEYRNTDAVILAAGLSSRAGLFKPALEIYGRTMLECSIDLFSRFCRRIIVVGGYNIEKISEIVSPYKNVILVHNSNYKEGMFSSVQTGVEATENDFFITPGDIPGIRESTVEALLRCGSGIIIPASGGKKGHPVFFSSRFRSPILNEPAGSNLRDFIGKNSPVTVKVNDPDMHFDIDTAEDYINFTNSWRNKNL